MSTELQIDLAQVQLIVNSNLRNSFLAIINLDDVQKAELNFMRVWHQICSQ